MFIGRHFEIFLENRCSKCLWQHLTDYTAKNAENLRSYPSFDEVQHGGLNNYVMHSNDVNLRPQLIGTADNKRTELLRTYPVKNLMLGSKFLRCCVNIMSRVQKNEINHDKNGAKIPRNRTKDVG